MCRCSTCPVALGAPCEFCTTYSPDEVECDHHRNIKGGETRG